MERSLSAEEKHGVCTPTSNSSTSLIKIDSISIDLVNGNETNEVGNCKHFSIRGYVAEIRKKDRKICWPFSIDDKHNDPEEHICTLPPLQAAKFRWWRCQNCLREIDPQGTAKEVATVPNCSNNGVLKSNSACFRMSSYNEAATMPSVFQNALRLNSLRGREVDANVNSDRNGVPSCTDKREKEAEVAQTTLIGHENSSKNDANKEFPRPSNDARKIYPCLKLERRTGDTALESKCNGFVESCKPNCGINEAAADVLNITKLNCPMRKDISVDDQNKEPMTVCGTSGVPGGVNESVFPVNGHASEHPSLEFDAHDYASSESDEILGTNSLLGQHHDDSSIFHRQKPQKVRLLAELLVADGNANADYIMEDDAPSSASAAVEALSVSQGKVNLQGNLGRGFKGQTRKRKTSHDGDWRSPEMSSPSSENKKSRIFKGDVENTANAIAGSKSNKDASAGTGSQAGKKNHWNKHGVDSNPILNRKIKKTWDEDRCSSLLPLQEVVPRRNEKKIQDADKSNSADTASTHEFSTGRVMGPLLRSFFPAERTERKSSLCKKKNKMTQAENLQAFLMPLNNDFPRENSITRQNVKTMQSRPAVVQFQSLQDASDGKGPYFSYENYSAAQENNRNWIPHIEGRPDCLLPRREGIFREDQVRRKDVGSKYVGESSVPYKSASDAFIDKEVSWDLSIKTGPNVTSSVSEKRKRPPHVEDRDLSTLQKMDVFGRSNSEKAIRVEEHSEFLKKQGHERADKVFEQGAIDDIPMEIVELLAKNRYERRHQNAEKVPSLLETTYKARNGERIEVNKVHADGELKLPQEENPHLQKSQSSNARKNMFTIVETVEPTNQKSVSNFPHMSLQEGSHTSRGFQAFSQCQQKLSSGVQFPSTCSSRHEGARNCKWDGNMQGHLSFPTSLQAFKAYDQCLTAPQHKSAGVGSSMMQNRMSYGRHIPQNYEPRVSSIDMLSHHPGTLQKGKNNGDSDMKFLNLNVASYEKQNRNFGSETINETHGEYPYACHKGIELYPHVLGSVDMHSNETIPAMQLLSLMDPGMRSTAPFSVDEKTKFLKRSSFPQENQSKEFSGTDIGLFKTGHASRHVSSVDYRKNLLSEKSCECLSAVPAFGALTSSLQKDISIRRATDLVGQLPVKSREKGKAKKSYSPRRSRVPKSQKYASSNVGFGTNCEFSPVQSTEKRFLGASDLIVYPSQCRTMRDSMKHVELEPQSSHETVWPVKRSPAMEICSLNRNPADFSMPVAGNMYMIGAEDLKFVKRMYSGDRSSLINVNRQKKQRLTKLTAAKERAWNQIPRAFPSSSTGITHKTLT